MIGTKEAKRIVGSEADKSKACNIMRGSEVWNTFKAAQKSANVYNSSWRKLKSGENKSGLLRQIRESFWPMEEKQKNVKRVQTRASSKKFNTDDEKASWIATEIEDANKKIEPFNTKWFPSGWLTFAYLGYPSGLNRQEFTCFNPPQREEVESQMKKAYEDLGQTGNKYCLSICYSLFLSLISDIDINLGNKTTRRKSRDTSSMSTPLTASGDDKSTVSRGSRVININVADDVDATRMKVNATREITLKSAIQNFERDPVRFSSEIEKARDALDAHYMDMINEYAPVRKMARFE